MELVMIKALNGFGNTEMEVKRAVRENSIRNSEAAC